MSDGRHPVGAVRVGEVAQRAGLVPTILGMGAIHPLVTLGMFVKTSHGRWRQVRCRRTLGLVLAGPLNR